MIIDLDNIYAINYNSIFENYLDECILEIKNNNTITTIEVRSGIADNYSKDFDDEDYYDRVNYVINNLNDINRKVNIVINLINRNIFNKYINFDNIGPNINLYLLIDNISLMPIRKDKLSAYLYTIEEYKEEENLLDGLLKDVSTNDSPLEKYLKIYNIVKNYKPYKENDNDLYESRYLKYILHNEYMVCVGFSILLKTLLERVNIPCITLDTFFYFEDGYDKEGPQDVGHQRNLVYIKDEKYSIDGIYVADPTFDNNICEDKYDNCLLTINERIDSDKIALKNKFFKNFSFKNKDEFLNLFKNIELSEIENNKIIPEYSNAIKYFCRIVQELDMEYYIEYLKKYEYSIKEYSSYCRKLKDDFKTDNTASLKEILKKHQIFMEIDEFDKFKKTISDVNELLIIIYDYVIKKFNNSVSEDVLRKCINNILQY